ncbi:calcium-binding protein [Methylobacterium sp. 77]|uniref:calcium-binding protein n=1 Tax=Methylobacterium sp. 77 TaxID=1101192 RepID=UPI00036E4355|nr:calcium-binding protein [Methylobacterium sp. 77]
MSAESQAFDLTTWSAGIYGDSSDFDYVTRVTGGDFGDVFRTGDGNDVLNGGGGNDVLEGGRGSNIFNGGTGTNTLSYEHFDAPSFGISYGMNIDLRTGEADDGTGTVVQDTFTNIANVRGSQYDDVIDGDIGNNVIEGGAGSDFLKGGGGIDTLSYEHSSAGVIIGLQGGTGSGGDAEGDVYTGFESVLGSTSGDVLSGDGDANTLIGNGGDDALYGRGGDDRLIISSSPVIVNGGGGTDMLFIAKGSTVALTDVSFSISASIEKVYVRDGASITMTGVDIGTKIFSQSLSDGGSTIVGTDLGDRIQAGKGDDVITGGLGGDSLFGGAGADTFVFAAGDGRDVIRKFDVLNDVLDVRTLADDMSGLEIRSFHGAANAIITFTGDSGPSDKIILLGVTADSLTDGSFIF